MNTKLIMLIIFAVMFSANAMASSTISYQFDISKKNDTSITLTETISSSSVLIQINTNQPATCRYSETAKNSFNSMQNVFDIDLETIHKKTLTDLSEGLHKFYIRCKNNSGGESAQLEAIFAISLPVSAQIILEEDSPLKNGKTELTLITSKVLSQTPSLSYSFDSIGFTPIPLFGSGTKWTGFLIIPNSADEEVGSFKFQGRDLEGNIGTDITNGGIFLIDTKKPATITDIKAEGLEGKIKLFWHHEDEEDVDEFKIYKSTTSGVGKADFLKSVAGTSFTDTLVEKGKTYYYKISPVDEAENEGELSSEVYATALLENIEISKTGLETRFLGIVDSFISEIDSVIKDSENIKQNFAEKAGKEKTLYENLKLSREIDSSKFELNSLKKEIENIKSQNLDRNELDRKLDSGRLKLNTIKKKIPENIIIVSEKTVSSEINENGIVSAILEITPDIEERNAKKTLSNSLEAIQENDFEVTREGFNLELSYLNGERKEISLIKEKISSSLSQNQNLSIIEIIPKEIAESTAEMDIKNIGYEILKEDPIISFSTETKEIIYSMKGHLNLDSLNKIKTLLIHKTITKEESSSLTGYAVFSDFSYSKNSISISLGIMVISSLLTYLYIVKRKRKLTEKLFPLKKRISLAQKKLNEGEINLAKQIYFSIAEEYKKFSKKEKRHVYTEIENLHKKILQT